MNKSEFFSFLDDNQSEIIMADTKIKTVNRGSVVEIALSIPGYAAFTLSRHKPNSQKLAENEVKFARWFMEWSEIESVEVQTIQQAAKDIIITQPAPATDLFDVIEFISMRTIPGFWTQKKPGRNPAKVTQQKKDKEYPQTSSQQFNAMHLVVANLNYHLSFILAMINLSEIITYVFIRRRRRVRLPERIHRIESVLLSVVARTGRGPPRITAG